MSKHTPGPWKVTPSNQTSGWGVCIEAPGRIIAKLTGRKKNDKEANARLIAAAPELLEALERTRVELEHAASDILQTARANQLNLTGTDPVFPGDHFESSKGQTLVHQKGIDDSLKIRKRCLEASDIAREAIAKATTLDTPKGE